MQKEWWKSKTIWSLVAAAIGVAAPKYATAISQTTGDVITLIGIASATYGRFTANKELVKSVPTE